MNETLKQYIGARIALSQAIDALSQLPQNVLIIGHIDTLLKMGADIEVFIQVLEAKKRAASNWIGSDPHDANDASRTARSNLVSRSNPE